MKILLDSCIWNGAAEPLRFAGHDVSCVGEWATDPGDEQILTRATQELRVLVTLDKDFGTLANLKGMRHSGILRIVNFSAKRQAEVCLNVLASKGDELLAGATITAEPGRLRVRPPQ